MLDSVDRDPEAEPMKRPYDSRLWRKIRLEILERDNHRCQIRGPKCIVRATHVDHVIPWTKGGAWFSASNLRSACRVCNIGKKDRMPARLSNPSREWL